MYRYAFQNLRHPHSMVLTAILYFRCIVLTDPQKSDGKSLESWNTFLSRLRQLLLQAFSRHLQKYEDNMRALREKRNEVGWNFHEYFIVQVCTRMCLSFWTSRSNLSLLEEQYTSQYSLYWSIQILVICHFVHVCIAC